MEEGGQIYDQYYLKEYPKKRYLLSLAMLMMQELRDQLIHQSQSIVGLSQAQMAPLVGQSPE